MARFLERLRAFLGELKRRSVYKVAVAYGAVAFVVVQAARLLVPALILPEWLYRGVVLVAILGFPFALVFTWAFELTPEGMRRTNAREQHGPSVAASGRRLEELQRKEAPPLFSHTPMRPSGMSMRPSRPCSRSRTGCGGYNRLPSGTSFFQEPCVRSGTTRATRSWSVR